MELQSTIQKSKEIVEFVTGFGKENTNDKNTSIIQQNISWWLDDIFKIVKNIDQTSLNKFDRTQRLIELESKYGIPKTHLL